MASVIHKSIMASRKCCRRVQKLCVWICLNTTQQHPSVPSPLAICSFANDYTGPKLAPAVYTVLSVFVGHQDTTPALYIRRIYIFTPAFVGPQDTMPAYTFDVFTYLHRRLSDLRTLCRRTSDVFTHSHSLCFSVFLIFT